MTRTGSASWVVDTTPISVTRNGAAAPAITNGILERVTPDYIETRTMPAPVEFPALLFAVVEGNQLPERRVV